MIMAKNTIFSGFDEKWKSSNFKNGAFLQNGALAQTIEFENPLLAPLAQILTARLYLLPFLF